MTSRRRFLLATATAALAPARALARARPVKVGMLNPRPLEKSLVSAPVVRALADLGYRHGQTMTLEYRSTEGFPGSESALVRELLELKCDLIFALGGERTVRAFRGARSNVPVVFFAVDFDPMERGIVDSQRRPGGNMTGVYMPIAALAIKKLEIALEVLPGARRFLVVSDADSKDQLEALKSAAKRRSVELTVVEYAKRPYDLAAAFETGKRAGVDGFIGVSSPGLSAQRGAIAEHFASQRLPAFVGRLSSVEPGFLIAYAADIAKGARRVAAMGVKVLKGAKPADIPVEQVDEFEMIVNLRTAKALGVKIPASVMARATKLIE